VRTDGMDYEDELIDRAKSEERERIVGIVKKLSRCKSKASCKDCENELVCDWSKILLGTLVGVSCVLIVGWILYEYGFAISDKE
jgi:hypothetical protein